MSKNEADCRSDADTAAQLKARLDRWQTYQNTENAAGDAPIAVVPGPAAYPWAKPSESPVSREMPAPPVSVVLPAYRRSPQRQQHQQHQQQRRVPLPDTLSAATLPEENRATELWSGVAFALVVLAFILGLVAILAHFFWKA